MVYLTLEAVMTQAIVNQCIDHFLDLFGLSQNLKTHREFTVVPDSVFVEMGKCLRNNLPRWMSNQGPLYATVYASSREMHRRIYRAGMVSFLEPELENLTTYLSFCVLLVVLTVKSRGRYWLEVMSRWISEFLMQSVLPWMESQGGWAAYFEFCSCRSSGIFFERLPFIC